MTEFGLVMPFIACESNGGPFDDAAYVAGAEMGDLMRMFSTLPPEVDTVAKTVHTANVPQLDLVAMHNGFVLAAEAWEDAPDEWSLATFTRADDTIEDDD